MTPNGRFAALLLLLILLTLDQHQFLEADHSPPVGDEFVHIDHALLAADRLESGVDLVRLLYDQAPSRHYPPLLYAVTAPVLQVHRTPDAARRCLLFFAILLTVAAFWLGLRLWGPAAGLVSAAATATTPAVLNHWALYYQDLTVAALALANVAVLEGSDSFRRRWSWLPAGAVLGLGLLTKQSFWIYVLPAWALYGLGPAWRAYPRSRALLSLPLVALPAAFAVLLVRHWMSLAGVQDLVRAVLGPAALGALALVSTAGFALRQAERRDPPGGERRRLVRVGLAVGVALLIAGPWLALGAPEYLGTTGHTIMQDFRRLYEHAPGHAYWSVDWAAFHGPAYLGHLVHFVATLPLVLSYPALAWLLRRQPGGPGTAAMLVTPVWALAVLSFLPVYQGRYLWPAGPFLGVLAGAWVPLALAGPARILARLALAAILLAGLLQAVAWRPGPSAVLARWPETFRPVDEVAAEEANWMERMLCAYRVPLPGQDDVPRLFDDLQSDPDLLPILVILPQDAYGAFHVECRIRHLEEPVHLFAPNVPGMDGEPPPWGSLGSVLVPEEWAGTRVGEYPLDGLPDGAPYLITDFKVRDRAYRLVPLRSSPEGGPR